MPKWVTAGFEDYAKRISAPFSLELTEIATEKRLKNTDISRLIQREGEKLQAACRPRHQRVALDVKGQSLSTEMLTERLRTLHRHGTSLDLLIGGPDGLATECLASADWCWSLSPLTLPHPLVRILLAEQLYRAVSLLKGHPYHR